MDEGLSERLRAAAAAPRLDMADAAEVARRGRRRRRGRVAGLASVPALVVLAGLAVAGVLPVADTTVEVVPGDDPGHAGSEIAVPPAGETAAAELDDGSPVFVVHHDDGAVDVLSAVSTHLDHLVIWCAPERVFVEPIGATIYEADGTWRGGPAADGLAAYDVDVVDRDGQRVARVGALQRPPERPSDDAEAPAGDCVELTLLDDGDDVTTEADGTLLPTAFRRVPLRVKDLEEVPAGSTAVVEATLDLDPDPARLCADDRDACGDTGLAVTSSWWHDQPLDGFGGTTQGRFLVRVGEEGSVGSLAQLRRETTEPMRPYTVEDDLTRIRGTYDIGEYGAAHITHDGQTCLVDSEGRTEHCADLADLKPGEPSVAFVDRGTREAAGEEVRSMSAVVLLPVADDVAGAQMLVEARGGVEPAELDRLTERVREGTDEAEAAARSVVTEAEPPFMWGRIPPAEECVAFALFYTDGNVADVVEDVEAIMPDEALADRERDARAAQPRGC